MMIRALQLNSSDRDLERRIINFLARQHFPLVRSIAVAAKNGAITLRGRVHSFYERQLCISCCQRVAGVVELVDQLEVAESPKATSSARGFAGYSPLKLAHLAG